MDNTIVTLINKIKNKYSDTDIDELYAIINSKNDKVINTPSDIDIYVCSFINHSC